MLLDLEVILSHCGWDVRSCVEDHLEWRRFETLLPGQSQYLGAEVASTNQGIGVQSHPNIVVPAGMLGRRMFSHVMAIL